jgi:hypothetical protein
VEGRAAEGKCEVGPGRAPPRAFLGAAVTGTASMMNTMIAAPIDAAITLSWISCATNGLRVAGEVDRPERQRYGAAGARCGSVR